MTEEHEETYEVPRRRNGEEKAFWYDPAYPRHIIHNCRGVLVTICVGHQDR